MPSFFMVDPNLLWVLGSVFLLGLCAGGLGTILNLRRQGLLGDVLAHAALPGVAFSFFLFQSRSSFILMLGALCSCALAYLLIHLFVTYSKIKSDSAFAIILSLFFAVGAGMITYLQKLPLGSQSGLDRLLFGQAGALVASDLHALILLSILTLIFFLIAGRKLKEITFDRQFCAVQGVSLNSYDGFLAMLAVALIALSLQLVGAVMLAGLLIIPAAAARLWIKTFWQMVLVAAVLGAASGVLGVLVSYRLPAQPTGPWIVVWASLLFMCSFLFAPRRGVLSEYLKQKAFKDRIDQENILRSIFRELEKRELDLLQGTVGADAVMLHRSYSRYRLQHLLKQLVAAKMLCLVGGQLQLTEAGLLKAQQLTKGHRLWESLLATGNEGDPAFWHEEAEEVEHFLSQQQVSQLQERLQQPDSDPHGQKIPGDNN